MRGRSLLSDGIGTGRRSIFVAASKNYRHLSSVSACSETTFCCSYLTSTATGATSPGISMTVSENRLRNFGKFTTLYTLQTTNVSKAAKRRYRRPFNSPLASRAPDFLPLFQRVSKYLPPPPDNDELLSLQGRDRRGFNARRSFFREDLVDHCAE